MAASLSPLNKKLWTELTKVKLLDNDNNLKQDDLPRDFAQNVIIGRLWLTSNIYKNHALRIEIHLRPDYPATPPEVNIKTPIYHPNVNETNRVCDPRLNATALWNNQTTLIGVLEIVVDALDKPNPDDGPANADAAKEFTKNRAQYDQKATAMIQKNGLPRS